jgi:Xaa-Pro aminopeptidase
MLTPAGLDPLRMHAYRRGRLREAMRAQGIDGLVLLGATNVEYAGARPPVADAMRMHLEPVVVIAPASGPFVICTRFPEDLPAHTVAAESDVVRPPLETEYPEGVAALAALIRETLPDASRIGFDEFTSPMIGTLPELLPGVEITDGTAVTAAARLIKSADEIACLTQAQRINELAMYDVEAMLAPGVRQNELSATFLRRVFELGATANIIDPIWSITPRSVAEGTYTANGDVGFPLASNDRFLREGDLILCDTGLSWNGYHSDFGKTWICSLDPKPTPALRDCYQTWRDLYAAVCETIKPGATCGDLVRAAMSVQTKYGLAHFYLGHGVGCDSAEAPFICSDLGLAFDDTVELAPGMVFVLEPVVWRDGVGGYRSEELIVVNDGGYEQLTAYGYTPFE